MEIKSNTKIADDVIPMIAGIAATNVDGVVSMGEGITFKAMSFIGSKSLKKGIEIINDGKGSILCKLTVVIKQGMEIRKVCTNIQEKVKEALESMLDVKVKQVIVRVAKVEEK